MAGKSFPSARPGDETGHSSSESKFAPGLYITATPIGNAADITLRALNLLKNCDAIVAEDTRVTSRLLSIHGISRPLFSYNDHNAASMRPKLLARLRGGAVLALVSDAGTPLVSDPGYKLVRAAREDGIAVFPVPGPCAAVAGLTVAGLPSDRFFFAGFLPPKSAARRAELGILRAVPSTLIFYEAPQRLAESLADMANVLGAREAAVTRELTKLHEEVRTGSVAALAKHYADAAPVKGEITIVVGPPPPSEPDAARIDALLGHALVFMPVKAASNLVAEATGAARRMVYLRALALKGEAEP